MTSGHLCILWSQSLWVTLLVEAPSQVISVGPTFDHKKHTFILLSEEAWTYGQLVEWLSSSSFLLCQSGSHSELPSVAAGWATVGAASSAISLCSPAQGSTSINLVYVSSASEPQ